MSTRSGRVVTFILFLNLGRMVSVFPN
jgi:hypothetical protein